MGTAIAERLLEACRPLAVWNRSSEKADDLVAAGATRLEAARDALRDHDVAVTMLSDDDALEDVAAEIASGARAGTTLVDMSTVSPAASARVGERLDAAGVAFVRAPVSGNPGVVRAGNLTIVASGPEPVVRELEPLLKQIGPKLFYVGEGDRARVVKLALQVLIAGTAELLAEALVLAERAGVAPKALLEVANSSAVGSPFFAYKTEPLLRGDYSATFTTAMMLKDVDLVLELARVEDAALPLAQELRGLLEQAADAGHADADFMALYLHRRA